MSNPVYPGVVFLSLGVRVRDFELDPISWVEKHLMVKLVTVLIHPRNDIEILLLEFVGHRVAPVCEFLFPETVQALGKIIGVRMATEGRK